MKNDYCQIFLGFKRTGTGRILKNSKHPKKFGRVIKEARIGKGLSQKQMPLAARMKQSDISRIEEGKKNITLFTMIRLCKILGIKKIDLS